MNKGTTQEKKGRADPIVSQLKRVRGQIDGIISMYENKRTCVDIIHQIIAARSSLGKVSHKILTTEVSCCSKKRSSGDLDNILKEIFR